MYFQIEQSHPEDFIVYTSWKYNGKGVPKDLQGLEPKEALLQYMLSDGVPEVTCNEVLKYSTVAFDKETK